ncbi:MAG TPA: SusC/RagA family TonB-linked outer membrane protein, partial [Rhodothermales bacterium]|nr:SusC/RagA family TonB-linked outer membrane protein [Rhodothermales bacterium]
MRYFVTRGLLSIALTFLCVGLAFGQQTVTGTVTDAGTSDPMPGVSVVVKGTTTGTITDFDGNYSLSVPSDAAILVYTFIGYETHEEPVMGRTTIDVALNEDITALQDVVVVGYGEQRREAVTGSVATVDAEDALQGLVTAPTEMLQGRVPGVNVIQSSGEPGAGVSIRIRGGTSISASNEPLYVIDGVPIENVSTEPGGVGIQSAAASPRNPLNTINPNDIATLTVLKDAAATAIYGSRGANGVVLIETKSGQAGHVQVDYEGYVSSATASNTLDLASGDQYRNFIQSQVDAKALGYTDDGVLQDEDGNGKADVLDALGSANTDWYDAVLRNAVSNFHNLAISGGTAATQYRASVSYLNEQGVVLSSGLQRVTGRLNANQSVLNNRLRFDLNLSTTYEDNDYAPIENTGGFQGGLFTNVISYNPTQPIFSDNAAQGQDPYYEVPNAQALGVLNPVALANQIQDVGKTARTLGNLGMDLDLLQNLTLRLNVGADHSTGARDTYWPAMNPIGAAFNGRALQREKDHTSSTFQSYLTYRTAVGKNALELLGGYEYNQYYTQEFGAESRDFVTDFWGYNNLGGGKVTIKPYSYKESSRLVSFFGRANYNYGDRYFLQGVLRRDGSSRFGAGNKWALFPAISGAWRISDESFMQGISALSDLKLRVGWGITGSQEIGNYQSLALLTPDPGARAVLGGAIVTGVAPSTYANPNLRWEQTSSFNVGLDYGFAHGKYSGTLEFYQKDTDDLLLTVAVPQPAVVPTRLENIGSMRNRGVEFTFDALAVDKPDANLMLGLVFSSNQNEIVSLGDRDRIFTGTVSGRGQSDVNSL